MLTRRHALRSFLAAPLVALGVKDTSAASVELLLYPQVVLTPLAPTPGGGVLGCYTMDLGHNHFIISPMTCTRKESQDPQLVEKLLKNGLEAVYDAYDFDFKRGYYAGRK